MGTIVTNFTLPQIFNRGLKRLTFNASDNGKFLQIDNGSLRPYIERPPLVGKLEFLSFGVTGNTYTDENGYLWVVPNGVSICRQYSNATIAIDKVFNLYLRLWTVSTLAVAGGRGVNAQNDWSFGKALSLPDYRGRVLVMAGQGTGLTNRLQGVTFGAENHALTAAQMPVHSHNPEANYFSSVGSGNGSFTLSSIAGSLHRVSTAQSQGNGQAHNICQPSAVCSVIIATGEKA